MIDRKLLIALNCIPNIGPVKIKNLAESLKDYQQLLKSKPADLMNISGIGKRLCDKIIQYRKIINPDKEIEKAEKLGVEIITLFDDEYPNLLKQIYDPPAVLYVKGNISALNMKSIAIVGSRKATVYGKKVAMKFANELALMSINIVSGMARGIDSFAHKGAIEAGGPTTAVLGCGIDIVYPQENKKLAEAIVECGCIISNFPLGTPPLAANFPARNRIISGLCLGTIVIEAAEKSGSLITADFALEQGREVFAVPGNIFSPLSRGTHKLIKQGAKLVENIGDIKDELTLDKSDDAVKMVNSGLNGLTDIEKNIYEIIDYNPIHIEKIIAYSRLNSQKVNSILTSLELEGYITSLPGGYFVRN